MSWASPVFEYQNCNLAMFRIIIPYLEKKSDMLNFEDNGVSGATLNERCSVRYINYVRNHVLLPAGLENPQPTYTSNNIAYSYNFEKQNVAGYAQPDNQRWETGAGSWIVSARDYVKFLAALENGKLIPKNRVSEMKSSELGIFATSSAIGNAYFHAGSIGGNKSDSYGSDEVHEHFQCCFLIIYKSTSRSIRPTTWSQRSRPEASGMHCYPRFRRRYIKMPFCAHLCNVLRL